jgi:hypothetical protein
MEAMAVGCAVVVLNEGMGLAGLVTPDNMTEWHRWNFGRRLLQKPIETGTVRAAIAGYSPAAAAAVSRYLRMNGSLERTAAAFSHLAQTVVAEEADRPAVGTHQENREFARYVLDVMRPPGPTSVPVQIGLLLAELEQERRLRAEVIEHERGAKDALVAELELEQRLRAEAIEHERGASAALHAQLDSLNQRWALVQRSVSWRITAPLRWVAGRSRDPKQAFVSRET